MEALRLTDNWPRQATPSVPRVVLLRSPCQWSAVQPIKIGARRSPVTTYRRRTPRSAARVVASRSQRCSLLRVAPSSQHSMCSMTHRPYGEKRKGLAMPVLRQSTTNRWRQSQPSHCIPPWWGGGVRCLQCQCCASQPQTCGASRSPVTAFLRVFLSSHRVSRAPTAIDLEAACDRRRQ